MLYSNCVISFYFIFSSSRCRELEQELLELQEFTKLENSVETQHLKKELDKRTVELSELKHDLEKKEQRLEQLEER